MYMNEIEIIKVIELGKDFPNNGELGKQFRLLYGGTKLAISKPNDFDLGNMLRKKLNQLNEITDLTEKLKKIEESLGELKNNN